MQKQTAGTAQSGCHPRRVDYWNPGGYIAPVLISTVIRWGKGGPDEQASRSHEKAAAPSASQR